MVEWSEGDAGVVQHDVVRLLLLQSASYVGPLFLLRVRWLLWPAAATYFWSGSNGAFRFPAGRRRHLVSCSYCGCWYGSGHNSGSGSESPSGQGIRLVNGRRLEEERFLLGGCWLGLAPGVRSPVACSRLSSGLVSRQCSPLTKHLIPPFTGFLDGAETFLVRALAILGIVMLDRVWSPVGWIWSWTQSFGWAVESSVEVQVILK